MTAETKSLIPKTIPTFLSFDFIDKLANKTAAKNMRPTTKLIRMKDDMISYLSFSRIGRCLRQLHKYNRIQYTVQEGLLIVQGRCHNL